MKLIRETIEDVAFNITEENLAEGVSKKNYFIEGVFMQGDIKNRNGRMYPSPVIAKEVTRYNKEYVEKKRAFGELGHPEGPTINLERVSHMITTLEQDGSNFVGKAKVMDTPMGQVVKNLMDEGATLGVSSRGMGSLKQTTNGIMEVQNDFMLATAGDIVADPSAPQAFVRGVMEGVDWIYDAASGTWQSMEKVDKIVSEARTMSRQQLEEQKFNLFSRFLNSL
tara:strand:+ start:17488 stop:18159 length:672 start_codon:yes stop_codon:yes gene_type:complete